MILQIRENRDSAVDKVLVSFLFSGGILLLTSLWSHKASNFEEDSPFAFYFMEIWVWRLCNHLDNCRLF
jgi:hypothetical protein